MSTVRQFVKCQTCGTHGHNDSRCPAGPYNKELEARAKGITAAMLFPGQPELVRQLERMQEYWKKAFANG